MRRLLLLAAAAIAVSAVPAQADYLLKTCGSGDYTVAEVTVADREVAEVCTSESPSRIIGRYICLPCLFSDDGGR